MALIAQLDQLDMDLNGNVTCGELPVFLLDHLGVHLLVLVEELIQVNVRVPVLQFLLLLSVSFLLFVDLHKSLFDELYVRFEQLDYQFQRVRLNIAPVFD